MVTPPIPSLDLSIRQQEGTHEVAIRFADPRTKVENRIAAPCGPFDPAKLRRRENDATETGDYGRTLSAALFSSPSAVFGFKSALVSAQQTQSPLRVRLFLDPNDAALHSLRWETLCEPDSSQPLCGGERVYFSRFLASSDWGPVMAPGELRDLQVLVVISNPSDLGKASIPLAPVDVEGELARAKAGLGEVLGHTPVIALASGGTANLPNICEHLRSGNIDILYLACHGALHDREGTLKPVLWLEDPTGTAAPTDADTVLRELKKLSLTTLPRLVVLASCESAGTGRTADVTGGLLSLAPRLAEAGVPAVVAMQGEVTMDTIAAFMPVFFKELRQHGVVDRAMAVARGVIGQREDYWAPVLYMRLSDGCLWTTPEESASKSGAAVAPHQLRPPVEDFVGRAGEIQTLLEALKADGLALAGIQGLGGTGKSALAGVVAQRVVHDYPDAQLWLDLKATSTTPRTPEELLSSCLRAFGHEVNLPDGVEELGNLYRTELTGKRVLIVLDNAANAAQVKPLVPPPGSALLLTSREAIALPGLKRVTLAELPLEEAVTFFNTVLSSLRDPVSTDIASAICQLCGCLPLAVRAAASLLGNTLDLDPGSYAIELRDERHRLEAIGSEGVDLGVEASLKLSYDRLPEPAMRVFRALSVFAGSFDAANEEAVCRDPGHKLLSDLVRRSLVAFDSTVSRYRMPSLVRVFAESRLQPGEDYHLEHAWSYGAVLNRAESLFLGTDPKNSAPTDVPAADAVKQALRLFDLEWSNIQAAKQWLDAQPLSTETVEQLGECLLTYGAISCLALRLTPLALAAWLEKPIAAARLCSREEAAGLLRDQADQFQIAGKNQERLAACEEALSIAKELQNKDAQLLALGRLATGYLAVGDQARALATAGEACDLARSTGDAETIAEALDSLAFTHYAIGDWNAAAARYEEALRVDPEHSRARSILASIYQSWGDDERADKLLQEDVKRTESDEKTAVSETYYEPICESYEARGKLTEAPAAIEKKLAFQREVGSLVGQSDALADMGDVYFHLGEWDPAVVAYRQAVELGEKAGAPLFHSHCVQLAIAEMSIGEQDKAVLTFEQALKSVGSGSLAIEVDARMEYLFDFESACAAAERFDLAQAYCLRQLEMVEADPAAGDPADILHRYGRLCLTLGDRAKGIEYLQQAVSQSSGLSRAINLDLLGRVQEEEGDFAAAFGYYERAADQAETHWNAALFTRLGLSYDESQPEGFEECCNKALELYRAQHEKRGEVGVLLLLAGAARAQDDLERAIEYRLLARGLHRDLEQRRSEASDLLTSASMRLSQGYSAVGVSRRILRFPAVPSDEARNRASQSLALLSEASPLITEPDSEDLASWALYIEADSFILANELDKALACLQRLLESARERKESLFLTLRNLLQVHFFLGNLPEVIVLSTEGLAQAEALQDPEAKAFYWNWQAAVFQRQGEAARAMELHNQVLQFAEDQNPKATAEALYGLSEAAERLGDREKAVAHAEAAVALYEKLQMNDAVSELTAKLAEWRAAST